MTGVNWLTPVEMAAWAGLLETFHLLDRQIEAQLRQDGGVTHVQYEILHRLSEAPGGRLRMTDLADQLIASRSGLTYQVAQLERRALVSREANPADNRGVLPAITQAGRDLLKHTAPGHIRTVRAAFLNLLSPEDTDQLAEIMSRVRNHLRATATSAGE